MVFTDLSSFHAHVAEHVVNLAELIGYFRYDACDSAAGLAYDSDDWGDLSHYVAELFYCLHSEYDAFKG